MDFVSFIESLNPALWVVANIILAYVAAALLVFVVMYYALFDVKATTGGRLIFRFMLSLVGVIAIVFLGIYIDPSSDREWFIYPGDVDWWRPSMRLVVYSYLAFTITSLAVLLVHRKWFPDRLKTAPSGELVKVRHETSEIPVVKPHPKDSDVSQ